MPFENSAFGEVEAAVERNLHLYRQVMMERRQKQERQEAALGKSPEQSEKNLEAGKHSSSEII